MIVDMLTGFENNKLYDKTEHDKLRKLVKGVNYMVDSFDITKSINWLILILLKSINWLMLKDIYTNILKTEGYMTNTLLMIF